MNHLGPVPVAGGTGSRQNNSRLVAAGLLCALGYLAVAWTSISLGWISSRPLYDGLTPLPPYRWVDPPVERVSDNQVPGVERFAVRVKADGGADPASVTTSDGQTTMTFDLITPIEGESFEVVVTPLAPQTLAAAPADGYFDGNAYRYEALYAGTQTPVKGSFTVVTRFSVHARQVLTLREGAWDSLFRPFATPIDQQVSARTSSMGTFVAASKGTRTAPSQLNSEEEAPGETGRYRWVNPPAEVAAGNEVPSAERFSLRVDAFGQTDIESVLTSDAQFSTSFDFLPEQAGLTTLEVVITPLEAIALGPPPKNQFFDGNAYKVEVRNADGTTPSPLLLTVDLRTLGVGDEVVAFGENGWEALADPIISKRAKRIEAKTMVPGTFAAVVSEAPKASAGDPSRKALYLVLGSAILLLSLFLVMRRQPGRATEVEIPAHSEPDDAWPPGASEKTSVPAAVPEDPDDEWPPKSSDK